MFVIVVSDVVFDYVSCLLLVAFVVDEAVLFVSVIVLFVVPFCC